MASAPPVFQVGAAVPLVQVELSISCRLVNVTLLSLKFDNYNNSNMPF